MNTNLLTIVKQIIFDYGEGILENPQRLKAFFNDLAKDEPKPLRIAFVGCIENGAYNVLKTAPDAAERASRKAAIAQRLRDDLGLDVTLCGEALDILEAALYKNIVRMDTAAATVKTMWVTLEDTALDQAIVKPTSHLTPSPSAVPDSMIFIKGGTFMMGSLASEPARKDNELQHSVTVSSFYLGKYLVTQKQYREQMGTNRSYFMGDNLPAEVSWYDAVQYCNRLSDNEGLRQAYTIDKKWFNTIVTWNRDAKGYRLPTEAEWEYSCRAGTRMPFNTGNSITTSQANYNGNYPYNGNVKGMYRERTTPVGTFPANSWGLYDMHGNVWEWCWDWYGDYPIGSQADPTGTSSGSSRVVRGGSWINSGQSLRSASRGSSSPSHRDSYIGFRVVRP